MQWAVMLFLGSMMVYSVRTAMSVCIVAAGSELGWDKQISGMVLSSFFMGYVTTNVLGGILADKYGGEKVVIYSGLVWSSVTLLIPMTVRYPWYFMSSSTFGIIAVRFLTGAGQGMFYPSLTCLIRQRNSITDIPVIYTFSMSGSSIGTILTGFFGSFLIENFNWKIIFIIIGLTALLWILMLKVLFDHTKFDTTKSQPPVDGIESDKVKNVQQKQPKPLWYKIFLKPSVLALIIAYFCNQMCFYNLLSWLPAYFHDKFPESKGWVFNVIPWVTNFVMANVSGILTRTLLKSRFSVTFVRKFNVTLCFLGPAIFLLLLNLVETFEHALLFMSLVLGFISFTSSGLNQNAQDLAPEYTGALYGLINCGGAVAGVLGVYAIGYILKVTGKWSLIFQLNSVACLLGLTTFLLFGSGERVL